MKKIVFFLLAFVCIQTHAQQSENYFITTWQTMANETITIPTTGIGYNYDVNWNYENAPGVWETGKTGDASHTYTTTGIHTIAIRGDFPRIYFNHSGSRLNIKSIEQWGTNNWSSMNNAFNGCNNLVGNATDIPNLSMVTDMKNMFSGVSAFNEDIGSWDVSNVTDMSGMFSEALAFNQDIGNWEVGNVTNMTSMFSAAFAFNQDISNWDVSNVTNMYAMFYNAKTFNQDIGNWEVGQVINMSNMFAQAYTFNRDLSNWDVGNVTDMSYMFYFATEFNQDIGNWDVGNVTDMTGLFGQASAFNQDLGNWDVSNVTDMTGLFSQASAFNQDLGNWDVSNVTDMTWMFSGVTLSTANYDALLNGWSALILKPYVSFDVGNSNYCAGETARNTMTNTFGWTITDGGFNCPIDPTDYFITTWQTTTANETITIPTYLGETYSYSIDWGDGTSNSNITGDGSHTYATAGTYTVKINGTFPRIYFNISGDNLKIQSIDQWGTNVWSSMELAFAGCGNLVGNAMDSPDLSNVTDMAFLFYNATSFNGDIGNWDVSNVTNMYSMFFNATSFNGNIGNWDVSNVINMEFMFLNASSFNQDVGNWNVTNVTNMSQMFNGASSFNGDIGNWNVSNVTDMRAMFYGASTFNQNIENWDVSNVTDMTFMFDGVTLSTANYDALLNGWNSLTLQNGVVLSGGNSNYCNGEAARQNMIDTFGWTITDGGLDCPNPADYFVTTWQTTTPNEAITIPTSLGETYNYSVDWGDGTSSSGITGDGTHIYATAGIYTVKINGTFPRIFFDSFRDRQKIISIDQWGTNVWRSMRGAFQGCSNLEGNATDSPDLSNVTDMSAMFDDASSFNENI